MSTNEERRFAKELEQAGREANKDHQRYLNLQRKRERLLKHLADIDAELAERQPQEDLRTRVHALLDRLHKNDGERVQ